MEILVAGIAIALGLVYVGARPPAFMQRMVLFDKEGEYGTIWWAVPDGRPTMRQTGHEIDATAATQHPEIANALRGLSFEAHEARFAELKRKYQEAGDDAMLTALSQVDRHMRIENRKVWR